MDSSLPSNSPLTSDRATATTQAISQAVDIMPIEQRRGYHQVEGYGEGRGWEQQRIRTTQQQQQHVNDPDLMAASALLELAESELGIEGQLTTTSSLLLDGTRGGNDNDTGRSDPGHADGHGGSSALDRDVDCYPRGGCDYARQSAADSESILGSVFLFLATLHKEGVDVPEMIMEFLELTREYNEERISLVEMKAGVEEMLRGCCDSTAATSRTRVGVAQASAYFGRCFHQDLVIVGSEQGQSADRRCLKSRDEFKAQGGGDEDSLGGLEL